MGALTHLQAKCPYNPNNKTYVVGDWDKMHDAVEELGKGFYSYYSDEAYYGDMMDRVKAHTDNRASVMEVTKGQEQFYLVLEILTVTDVYSNGIWQIDKFGLKDDAGVMVLDTGCVKLLLENYGWILSLIHCGQRQKV